jgi:hypothetical protein
MDRSDQDASHARPAEPLNTRITPVDTTPLDVKGISAVTDEGSGRRGEPTELPVVSDTSKAHQVRVYYLH